MKSWLTRIRGAVGFGVVWAVGWAIAGLLIGISSKLLPALPWNWIFDVFDAPLPALAIPGFFGGVFFSLVLGVAARRRRFNELSLPRFAAWGALGGLLLALFPFALAATGLATLNESPWKILSGIGVPFVLLGAASAAVSLKLARRAPPRDLAVFGDGAAASLERDVAVRASTLLTQDRDHQTDEGQHRARPQADGPAHESRFEG